MSLWSTKIHDYIYDFWTPPQKKKVVKPSVSRESFWNHSIEKWSDITSPLILNDSITCFIAFLNVFSTKNGYQKKHKKLGLPPPPYLELGPQF